MEFAFRKVPFTAGQREELTRMIETAGHSARWYTMDDELSSVLSADALLGYFPVGLYKDMPFLKWIQVPSAGVEKYCAVVYPSEHVVLTNCSGAFGTAIAEYILTGILMLMRRMPDYAVQQNQHVWKSAGSCRSISGSVVTIVGMGDIGTCLAEKLHALGAKVRGVRRVLRELPAYFDEQFGTDHLLEAISGADVVALCLPGTAETKGIIDKEIIDHLGKETILINVGRGSTVDQKALTDALQLKKIGGAVLDVFETEPLPADSLLWNLPNVILTPHISGKDEDKVNAEGIYDIVKENLDRFLRGEELVNIVDRKLGY